MRSRITRKVLPLSAVIFALTASLGGCNCDAPNVQFRAIRSDFKNEIRERDGALVFICPGESVTLGWVVQNADSASIDSGIGNIQLPGQTIDVKPEQDTHYKLTAKKGDCVATKDVEVFVVSSGKTLGATATLKQRAPSMWEAILLQQFYSPNILAVGGRMNAPVSQEDWRGNKIDLNGALHSFPLTRAQQNQSSSFAPFDPIQVAGTWQIAPLLQTEFSDPPSAAIFEVNLQCK